MSSNYQATAMLGLYAQTSIHAGTGQNSGITDLPIQREAHSGWPCVFGSALKGALRADAEGKETAAIDIVYGPQPAAGQDPGFGGALAVSDARLLLLPVRSLTSHFKWVSCPAILERLQRDADRLGLTLPTGFTAPQQPAVETAWGCAAEADLYLEEYRFTVQQQNLAAIVDALAALMKRDDAKQALTRQLVVLSDDDFAHLCQAATPVNAHVRIDNDTKTTVPGALWFEETLPPETLLYTAVVTNRARGGEGEAANWDASGVLKTLTGQFDARPWLQVGGNETVGMGWCAITCLSAGMED